MTIFTELEAYAAKHSAPPDEAAQKAAKEASRGFAGELVNSLVYSGLEDPLRALGQTVDQFAGTNIAGTIKTGFNAVGVSKPLGAEFGTGDWYAQNLGGAVGMLVPYIAARKIIGERTGQLVDRMAFPKGLEVGAKPGLMYLAKREGAVSAATGLFYGTMLRSSADENVGTNKFFLDRGVQGGSDALILGTLGFTTPLISRGLSTSLSSIERSTTLPVAQYGIQSSLTSRMAVGAFSAVPAGGMAAEVNALKDGRLLPSLEEFKHSVGAMAFVGTTLGGAGWLGAQKEGTLTTNGRSLTDRIGFTEPAPADAPATFRVVKGQAELNNFYREVASGSENVETSILVQPKLNTVASAFLGNRFATFGEARSLTLTHRGLGSGLTPNEVISADLVATCLPLEGAAASKDVFAGRTEAGGDGAVWMQPANKAGEFTLSRSEPLTVNDGRSAENSEAVALGAKRKTGPSEKPLNTKIDVLGQELANGSIRLNFDHAGDRVGSNIGAATVTTLGLTGNGWPYFEAGVGRASWKLNGEPLPPGRNYLDIKGTDVLTYNDVLNLRLTPGPKVGKVQTLEFRAERLNPETARSFRDVGSEILVNGQRLEAANEIELGVQPAPPKPELLSVDPPPLGMAEARSFTGADPVPEAILSTGAESVPAATTAGTGYGFIGRRPDGRLYFRANGDSKVTINGTPVPENGEVPFGSTDRIVGPDGKPLRIDNFGLPKPDPPPREPREGREGREGRERDTRERDPRVEERDRLAEEEARDQEIELALERGEAVENENGDIVDLHSGEILRAAEPTNEAPAPTITVDRSEVVPVLKIDGVPASEVAPAIRTVEEPLAVEPPPVLERPAVEPPAVEPPVKVADPPVKAADPPVKAADPPVKAADAPVDGVVQGVEVPREPLGLGEAKVQNHKTEGKQDTWSPTMEAMLAKAEMVKFPDGSYYPRFKSQADAREAARYFAKILQRNRSEHVRYGHGQVKDGYVPMVDLDAVEFGAMTFKPSPSTGELWLGYTPPKGTGAVDLLPFAKPEVAKPEN